MKSTGTPPEASDHEPATTPQRRTPTAWGYLALAALLVAGCTIAWSVNRWRTSETLQGGSFRITIENEPAGNYLGLYYRRGTARDIDSLITVLTSEQRNLPPTPMIVPDDLHPDNEPSELNAAAAAAWIAANRLLGQNVSFTAQILLAERQTLDLDELGIRAGDLVERQPGRLIVHTDGNILTFPGSTQLADYVHYRTGPQPRINAPDTLRGLSVGLAYALAYLDHLEPGDLSGSRIVAASGTISPSGHVGPVTGLEHKIRAALAAGADVILIPRQHRNVDQVDIADLRTLIAGQAELVEVGSLAEAAAWLCATGPNVHHCGP